MLAREKARSPHDYNSEVGVINLVATKYLPSNVPSIGRRPRLKASNGSDSAGWNYLQIHFGVEASTVMQWTVNPPVLTTPGSIPGYSTNSPVMD